MTATGPQDRLHFLDGLRGWASLVVLLHHTLQVWLINQHAMAERNLSWVLDFVYATPLGVLMDGRLAVHLFFCISGAALAYPVLVSKRPTKKLVVLSATRYPRLTVPILFACLIAYVLYAADAWNNVEAGLASQSSWLRKFYLFEPDFGSFVRFVFWDVYFGYDEKTSWNSALWTMPTELMCSFALFAILMVLRWRALRIAICAALAIYSVNSFSFGFFSGMLVAELIVAVNTSQGMRNHAVALSRVGLLLSVGAVVVAIWARSGFPQSGQFNTTLGKNMISLAMVLGGFMCVPVRNWLQSPISRQMGRSSFALYLVHMPIICSVSSGLYLACVGVLPFYALVFLVTAFTIVTSLVVAHAFTLVVEEKLLGSLKGFIALRVTRFAEADWTLRGLAYWRMVRRQLLPDLSGMRLRPTSMGAQQTGMEKFESSEDVDAQRTFTAARRSARS